MHLYMSFLLCVKVKKKKNVVIYTFFGDPEWMQILCIPPLKINKERYVEILLLQKITVEAHVSDVENLLK